MRKISILSLIAVLAATPMMAQAIEAAGKVDITTPAQGTAPNNGIATTSYVKGAYNAAIDEINTNRSAINTLNNNVTVAAGNYDTISADSTVGQNLAALDSKIAAVNSGAADAIDALDSTVSYAASGINISVAELNGKLTGVTAEIIDSAVTTDKIADSNVTTSKIANDAINSDKIAESAVGTSEIADGSVAFVDMSAAAVVTNEEGGISSTVEGASDSALVTEKAVAAAINTINGNAGDLRTDLTTETNARIAADSGLAADIVTAENAAKAYADQKLVTVYTTWNTSNSATVSLINTPAQQG